MNVHVSRVFRWITTLACVALLSVPVSASAQFLPDSTPPAGEGGSWADVGSGLAAPAEGNSEPINGDTYILPSSGSEVMVGDELTPVPPDDGDVQDQVLVELPQGIGAIAVLQGLGTPDSVMESYIGGFAGDLSLADEIFAESDKRSAQGLYAVDIDGVTAYVLIVVDASSIPDSFIIQVVAVVQGSAMEGAIDLMREHVSVDGLPMFAGVDELEIQRQVDLHDPD